MTRRAPPRPRPPFSEPRLAPIAILLHDLVMAGVSIALALAVRYHFEAKPLPPHLVARSAVDFVLICALVFPAFRLHRGLWR